nr:hypothetical protein REQ54_02567 [Rhizobium sp. Q54]
MTIGYKIRIGKNKYIGVVRRKRIAAPQYHRIPSQKGILV